MANEITVTGSLAILNGSHVDAVTVTAATYDQATQGAHAGVQIVGTSEETLAVGDISTEGWIVLRNLDTTNYVQWGFATTVYGGRMEAGEIAMFRMEPSATIYLKANTAACNVQVLLLED